MSFSCGCFVVPGDKVTPEMLKKHLVHTAEAMLFWELLGRRNPQENNRLKQFQLSEARMHFMNTVRELYPESVQEKDEAAV